MILFNRYEYNPQTDLVGKGGFSRVYKALDKKLNRRLALKIYKTNDLAQQYSPIAEIQRVIDLDHPNIARYIDIEEFEREDSFGEKEKVQVCVMELLEGGNFSKYYQASQDPEVLKKLLIDVLNGLSYLHRNGIIHRDIKPSNILIKKTIDGPVAKITDFGISKRSDSTSNSTSSALIVSIPYMAPEQLNAQKYGVNGKITYNLDFWSLGVAVYETITREPLFKTSADEPSEQVMTNILSSEVGDKVNNLSEPFRTFVSHCIVKDAKERIHSADQLISILQKNYADKIDLPEQNLPEQISPIAVVTEKAEPDADETRVLHPEPKIITGKPLLRKAETVQVDTDETQVLPATMTDETLVLIKPEKAVESVAAKESPFTLFNRYEYLPAADLIGKGGFARVYKAFDNKLGRWVALKIYKTSEFSERYSPIAEIRRVINLDHSNICRYLDIEEIEQVNPFGEKEKLQVCVMEFLDSGNIAEYFQANKDFKVLEKLVQDVLQGLCYLHKKGIIHRDIKPANILIKETVEGPVAKITDFGISKASDSIGSNSSSALIVSIPFMAPEQLNAKKYGIDEKISYNLDLWSVGVTIYEVITGNALFKNSENDNSEQIMANIMAPALPEKVRQLPQPFFDIVSHCLVKNARNRAQRAEELLELLNVPVANHTARIDSLKEHAKTEQQKPSPSSADSSATTRRAFFIADDEAETSVEKPVSQRKRSKKIFFVAAGVAAALIIGFLVFLFFFNKGETSSQLSVATDKELTQSQPVTEKEQAQPNEKEKAQPASLQPITVDSNVQKQQTLPPASGQQAVQKKEQEKRKPVRTEPQVVNNQPSGTISNKQNADGSQKYVLEIRSSEACMITIDTEAPRELKIGKKMLIYLVPGEHTLKAVSNSNRSFTKNIHVTEADSDKVGTLRINF